MSHSEALRKRSREETTLRAVLALMKTQEWTAEKACEMVKAEDKDLYIRSVDHYLKTHNGEIGDMWE